ncbi:MAG TPA: AtpZ/AtpI family protein, partial [Candidatus Cybelea sp.]|nr:AtpZ/AtpI family protein [Candidatus Cybelea sp.]
MNDPEPGSEEARSKERRSNQPPSLSDLQKRLDAVRNERSAAKRDEEDRAEDAGRAAAMSIAWRLAVEIVVAPAICGVVGWWIDRWLGTRPWFLAGFVLLGFASGL